jgi:hypothetical protein
MFRPCMPAGGRADRRVTWNHFFLNPGLQPGLAAEGGTPEAHEIAPAGLASETLRSAPEQYPNPTLGPIVWLAPGGEFLAVTAGTAGKLPGAGRPHAGLPSRVAAAATQRVNSANGPQESGQVPGFGNLRRARATVRTGELHRLIDYLRAGTGRRRGAT